MLNFKKEKAVVELIHRHIEATSSCVSLMVSGLRAYVDGKVSESKAAIDQVNSLESEADHLLREIRDMMYSGAYLPQIRGDIYRLMSSIDDVTNAAESCVDFFHHQAPKIPGDYQAGIDKLLELTGECFAAFEKALRAYFGPKEKLEKVRKHSQRVSVLESDVDKIESELIEKIFGSSMDKGDMLHLRDAIQKIAHVSDATENAADRLEWVSIKSVL